MYVSPPIRLLENAYKALEAGFKEVEENQKDIDVYRGEPVSIPSVTDGLKGGLPVSKPEDHCPACTSVQYIYHVTFRRCVQCGRESWK